MKKKNGFTLIELIVVIAISSIFLGMITTVIIQFGNVKDAITSENERVNEVNTLNQNVKMTINSLNKTGSNLIEVGGSIISFTNSNGEIVLIIDETTKSYLINGSTINFNHITSVEAERTNDHLLTIKVHTDNDKTYEYNYYVTRGIA